MAQPLSYLGWGLGALAGGLGFAASATWGGALFGGTAGFAGGAWLGERISNYFSSPAESSAASLDRFLETIWMKAARKNWKGNYESRRWDTGDLDDKVYDLYSEDTTANTMSFSQRTGYDQGLQDLSNSFLARAGGRASAQVENDGFWHFTRTTGTRSRIIVHAAGNHAMDVLRFIALDIVATGAYPAAVDVKIPRTAAKFLGRADNIIIYLNRDAEDAQVSQVVERLKRYRNTNPTHISPGAPPLVEQVVGGISIASQTPDKAIDRHGKHKSFGEYRSELIVNALKEVWRNDGDFQDFVAAVGRELRGGDINPNQPHLNLVNRV